MDRNWMWLALAMAGGCGEDTTTEGTDPEETCEADVAGESDMTGAPSVSVSETTAGGTFTVTVPVDADTGYVSVAINFADLDNAQYGGGGLATTDGGESVVVDVAMLADIDPGTYVPVINLCADEGECLGLGRQTAYTRGVEVGDYIRIALDGMDDVGQCQTAFAIPTIEVE